MEEQIWYDNISEFFNEKNYATVLPTSDMTIQEKLNAIVRFFLYLGVLLALIKSDYRFLLLGIVTAVFSVIFNEFERKKQEVAETFLKQKNLQIVDNKVCARSTVDNPFMNMSIADISLNPDHPEACGQSPEIKKTIDKNFNARLFRDVNDIYGTNSSQRQFYTMPVTTIMNDQTGVANWLYNSSGEASCKQGNGDRCVHNVGLQ